MHQHPDRLVGGHVDATSVGCQTGCWIAWWMHLRLYVRQAGGLPGGCIVWWMLDRQGGLPGGCIVWWMLARQVDCLVDASSGGCQTGWWIIVWWMLDMQLDSLVDASSVGCHTGWWIAWWMLDRQVDCLVDVRQAGG